MTTMNTKAIGMKRRMKASATAGPYVTVEDCTWLMEALRDSESELREAERCRAGAFLNDQMIDTAWLDENAFLAKIAKLERRRNAMLDVLAKHQQLEHQ
jgi:hypothetical protein